MDKMCAEFFILQYFKTLPTYISCIFAHWVPVINNSATHRTN